MLASQRIESVVGNWLWTTDRTGSNQSLADSNNSDDEVPTKRGATPSAIEWMILAWVSGKLIHVNGSIYHVVFFLLFPFRSNLERGETGDVQHFYLQHSIASIGESVCDLSFDSFEAVK